MERCFLLAYRLFIVWISFSFHLVVFCFVFLFFCQLRLNSVRSALTMRVWLLFHVFIFFFPLQGSITRVLCKRWFAERTFCTFRTDPSVSLNSAVGFLLEYVLLNLNALYIENKLGNFIRFFNDEYGKFGSSQSKLFIESKRQRGGGD